MVRDAALKMVAPGPGSSINREYYAQEHEKEIEEGRGAVEAYEKTDEKARELLRRLATSKPYYRSTRQNEPAEDASSSPVERAQRQIGYGNGPGPIRTSDLKRGGGYSRGGGRGGRGGNGSGRSGRPFPSTAQLPPGPEDINPPADPKITSLFVTGVEDDLPEHELRAFFSPFGQLRSLICSHRSHCAFVNFATREGAEAAALHCQGKVVIKGCPLRVRWGKPKPLDTMDRDERVQNVREGRHLAPQRNRGPATQAITSTGETTPQAEEHRYMVAPPPGSSDVQYASLAGD